MGIDITFIINKNNGTLCAIDFNKIAKCIENSFRGRLRPTMMMTIEFKNVVQQNSN